MLHFIIFAPLLGSVFSGFFYKKFNEKTVLYFTTSLIFISSFFSWVTFFLLDFSSVDRIILFRWMESGSLVVNWEIRLDSLTTVMLTVVTTISAFVHLYSLGYMSHDPNWEDSENYKSRFFSYLSFFTFTMLMLVTSNNFVQLFFGWEGVGLASYLLIGFYYKKSTANKAAMKAFIVNRIGDIGLALAIFSTFYYVNSLNFDDLFLNAPIIAEKKVEILFFKFNSLEFIVILFFLGAMGKSAQFFLHTWLPDAMEGPTPVSALIHAATMVTAGVFLVCRLSPVIEYTSVASNVIVLVGVVTALFAGTVALVQNDVKRIIAYSTCSQLGFMFSAAGIGLYQAAMFHLFTHAFFKALLFLGSGSVIHAFKDEQNINNMGGVWKKLPYTYCLMIIGTLALTGFPFLSGFYSKDAIIEFAYLRGNTTGYYAAGIGIFTALLTSIYSWRLIFKTFHGDYNNKKMKIDETHESPFIMLIPLILLSIGAIFAGFSFKELFIGYEGVNNFWRDSIFFLKPLSIDHPPLWFLLLTPTLVILSIPLAYYLFVKNKNLPEQIVSINKPLYQFLLNKWYFDELYDVLFVKTSKKFGLFLWKFFDLKIIDGFGPDGISSMIKKFSVKANKFQSGYIYHYAFIMLLGFSALLTFLIVK